MIPDPGIGERDPGPFFKWGAVLSPSAAANLPLQKQSKTTAAMAAFRAWEQFLTRIAKRGGKGEERRERQKREEREGEVKQGRLLGCQGRVPVFRKLFT